MLEEVKEPKFKVGDVVKVVRLDVTWSNYVETLQDFVGLQLPIEKISTGTVHGIQYRLFTDCRWLSESFLEPVITPEESEETLKHKVQIFTEAVMNANNLVADLECKLHDLGEKYGRLLEQHLLLQDETKDLLKFKLTALTHGIKDATNS